MMRDRRISPTRGAKTRALLFCLASLTAALALGCSSEDSRVEAPAVQVEVASPITAPEESEAKGLGEALSPPSTIREDEARGLLQRWLAAQNEGDFDAYAALYATPMRGVRRSGERVRRFDREGWLEDRRRMFGASMRVAATDVRMNLSGHIADVRFSQDWASGRYHDVGPKRMVLVREGDELRISLEEMERSELVAQDAPPEMTLPAFAFVVEVGRAWVVLDDAPPAELSAGRVHLLSRGGPLAGAVRRADRAKVSEVHRALVGTRISLYGASGQVCSGAVEGLHELRRFIPHFGQAQYWRGEDPEEGPRPSSAEVAAAIWQQGESDSLLVASIDAEGCEGALFAQEADAPALAMRAPRPSASADAYVEAARGTRSYREQQRAFDGQGPWHLYDGGRAEVSVYGEGEGAVHVVRMLAGIGCGDFGGALLQFYREGSSGPVRLLDGSAIINGRPVAVGDLDADGIPEILVEELGPTLSVYRLDETGVYRAGTRLATPYYDCGC